MVLTAPRSERRAEPGDRVVAVDIRDPDGSVAWYLDRSAAMASEVSRLRADGDRPTLIEFTDFEAPAWHALLNRSSLGLGSIPIAVRIHGPVEAITDAVGVRPPPLDVLSEMERLVFRMADVVIAPSPSVAAWAAERYGIGLDRLVVGPPPMTSVPGHVWNPRPEPHFVFYGRLAEAKGPHDLLASVVPVLRSHPAATLSLIGPDGWSLIEDRPMSELLRSLIPEDLTERIILEGRLPRDEAIGRLMRAWAVVLPSRFESFCLAAHEARRAGAPVVVPDLPAFDEFEEKTGSLKYDGSTAALSELLQAIAGDRGVVEPLADRPAPPVGDPLTVYDEGLPPPRHAAEQNGLATAAGIRLAEILEPGEKRSAMDRALRRTPSAVVRVVSRVTPGFLKSRVRAKWWKEEERRRAGARSEKVKSKIAAGEFRVNGPPRISVVVPCFDQGEWVESAVLSVFEQRQSSWEVILVDDGSTDPETVQTLDELASWPRVELIRLENRGLPGARNAGISRAQGEFFVPLDADDELHPEYLSSMAEALESNPDAGYAHCNGRYIGDLNGYWITRPYNPYQLLLSNSVLGCALVRRSAWEAVEGYDETMTDGHEDWEFWIKLLEAGWDQVKLPTPLFRYRIHGHTMSVDALAHLEEARRSIVSRHPDLFSGEAMKALKAEWYPWVTVICADQGRVLSQEFDDYEVLLVDEEESSILRAVSKSRGKFVVDWRLIVEPRGEELGRIAHALEADPGAEAVVSEGVPIAWRKWVLHDPAADPNTTISLDIRTRSQARPSLSRGMCPLPGWTVPANLPEPDLEVIRQRPEEEGQLPGWASF